MPTVHNIRNIRVAVYTNDHPPPHVHAVKPGGGRAKYELNCPDGPVRLVEQVGFNRGDVGKVGISIAKRLPVICAE